MSTNPEKKPRKKAVKLKDARQIIPDWKKYSLRPREVLFLVEYMSNGYNATEAYQTVFKNKSRGAAKVGGCEVLARGNVQACKDDYINRMLGGKKAEMASELLEILYTQATYDPSKLIGEDGAPAFAKIEDLPLRQRQCIEGITQKAYGKDADTTITEIKLASRLPAIEKLVKNIGLFPQAQADVVVETRISAETKAMLNEVFSKDAKKKPGAGE